MCGWCVCGVCGGKWFTKVRITLNCVYNNGSIVHAFIATHWCVSQLHCPLGGASHTKLDYCNLCPFRFCTLNFDLR